jgi:hypothetical protein
MKKAFVIILFFATTVAFGQTPDVVKVNQLHKKKFEWMINHNYDSLNKVVDITLTFIHSSGWTQTKQDLMNDLKSGKLNYTSIDVHESSVAMYKDAAVLTGKGTFKGLTAEKTEFNIKLLYTEVYIKIKNQWKLVSRQACKI